jgi:transposase
MIAPTSIPNRVNRQKTDRDDAMNNLHYHCSGLLRYVAVPDIEDERMRECLRERQRAVWACTKEKQKLLSLLKRQAVEYTLTKSNWTKKHYEWLRTVELAPVIRSLVDLRVHRIERFGQEVAMLWQVVTEYLQHHPRHAALRGWYMHLAGVGPVVSATLVLEGRDLARFAHPKPFMKFVGLIPGKRQSGGSDPALHITKEGNKYLRTALVGIAKFYQDPRQLHTSKHIKELPQVLQDFILRSQNRLYGRYRALRAKGKRSTKARVAVARELAAFLWEFSTQLLPLLDEGAEPKAA